MSEASDRVDAGRLGRYALRAPSPRSWPSSDALLVCSAEATTILTGDADDLHVFQEIGPEVKVVQE